MKKNKPLHLACGPKRKVQTLPAFQADDWQEVRLDIDASVAPDIIGTMIDMTVVGASSMGGLRSISPSSFGFCSLITPAKPNNTCGLQI